MISAELGAHDPLQLGGGALEIVVDDAVVEVALGGQLLLGDLEPGVDRLRRVGAAAGRRSRRTAGSGGAMKIWTESGFAARTCWAPWTSISSTTEWPVVEPPLDLAAQRAVAVAAVGGELEEVVLARPAARTPRG